MSQFRFDSYSFDSETGVASFKYILPNGQHCEETITFSNTQEYHPELLDRALALAFIVIGTSYYKTFPTATVDLGDIALDEWQANFFSHVYQEGLGQYAFENGLTRDNLAHFVATTTEPRTATDLSLGSGVIALQSGGKDSLLTAQLLEDAGIEFTPWYVTNSGSHPAILDTLKQPLVVARRAIDHSALKNAAAQGGKNGHVPVTYIVQSLALIQAVLSGVNTVLVSIAHEGEEPHAFIGDLPVAHQWSKTWQAEQDFAEYVRRYISPSLRIGSPLRQFSERRVSDLFVERAWARFGHAFSSCNEANYRQNEDNSQLKWCGHCPKCANAYLLFSPTVPAQELQSLFDGKDLFAKPILTETFKGLLGIDGVMKPFECIGEIDELRAAYHGAQNKGEYAALPFEVPASEFDDRHEYPSQEWARTLVS